MALYGIGPAPLPPPDNGRVGQSGRWGGLTLAGCQVPSQPLNHSPPQQDRGGKK